MLHRGPRYRICVGRPEYKHQDVTISPLQIASLIFTLSINRHITKQYSITTAIVVPSARITDLFNTIFTMYKPVGHVEVTQELKSAKEHCKAQVVIDENLNS